MMPPCSASQEGASSDASKDDLADRVSRLEAQEAGRDRADAIRRGARIYGGACAACHGAAGKGDGPGAAQLNPPPRDFTAAKFRLRSTRSGERARRSDLEETVRRGVPGTLMPAFGGVLSSDDISDVVGFVLSLASRVRPGPEPDALAIPAFPAPTAGELRDGRAVYLAVGCWKCHGLDGSGRGPSAPKLASDEGLPIKPRDFRHGPFKRGRSPETIARAAVSGLIGTPMPSHAEVLVIPREAIDAVASSLPAAARKDLDEFREKAPSSAEVMALDDDAWQKLRDANLVALAHYVMSLGQRDSIAYWLFWRMPELEGRGPDGGGGSRPNGDRGAAGE